MSTTLTIESGSLVVDFTDVTVQVVEGGTGDPYGVITRDGPRTVVFIPAVSDGDHKYVQLPSGADVGDVVEIYSDAPTITPAISAPSGETIAAGRAINGYGIFRKVSSTVWAYI